MAFPAGFVWEVQVGGDDLNGGGFLPGSGGTDYSQQAAPQLTITDAVTNGTTTITSATGGFTSAMAGSGITLNGGTASWSNVRRYIVSVTNSNTIVVDALFAASTGGTLRVGGCLATIPAAINTAGPMVNGNKAWVKGTSGIFTLSATCSIKGQTTDIEAYGSLRGDKGIVTVNPTVGSITCFSQAAGGAGGKMEGFYVNGNGQTAIIAFASSSASGAPFTFVRCEADQVATGFNLLLQNGGRAVGAFKCIATRTTSNGIVTQQGCMAMFCVVRDYTSGFGINFGGNNSGYARLCAVYGGNGSAIIGGAAASAVGATIDTCIVHNITGSGVAINGGGYGANNTVVNSVFSLCSAYGISGSTLGTLPEMNMIHNNAFYSCTSGNVNGYTVDASNISLSADPFVNTAGLASANTVEDIFACFQNNAVAGGGLLCKGAGLIPYQDIGIQHQDAGGAAGIITHPGMMGI